MIPDGLRVAQEKSATSIVNMSTKETHYKVLDGNYDIQAEEDSNFGYIKAVVSVFNNIDLANEVVLPGAYAKSIQRKLPAAVWNHNWSSPIAKTLEAIELLPGDERLPEDLKQYGGLYISAEFPLEVEESRQAYLKLKNGLVDEFSVGYRVIEAYEENDGVIYLKELDLLEWSAVMRGANPITKLIEVKNLTFQDHTDLTLSQLNNYIDRYESLAEKRQKLSSNHINNLETLLGRISTLIDTNKPPEEVPTPDVVKPSKKAYAIELLNFLSEDTE